MLTQCFDGLKLYGKEPESLPSAINLFQMVLADYPLESIRSAFAYYLKNNTEMPTPADISQIIEWGERPKPDKTVYLSLVKKLKASGDAWYAGRGKDEDYVKAYESYVVNG